MSSMNDLSVFTIKQNAVVQFESTWNSDSNTEKGVSIPTQTDDVPATMDKTTTTQELRQKTTQTEPFFAYQGTAIVNENRLAESLRELATRMERELKLGTTTVFRFED